MKNKILIMLLFLLTLGLFPTSTFGEELENNKFTLMPLPYAYDALEPYMDKETVTIHHDKHHQTYVDNLNKALVNYPELYSKGLEGLLTNLDALPKDIKQSVINNAGGVYNHNFFWTIMAPEQPGVPTGKLAEAIERDFGSFNDFKVKFKEAALGRFGSGWAWLVADKEGKLSIITTANQDCPISQGLIPIIAIDVWEHAYYLKYQNRRGEYIDNWWNLINWKQADKNYS